MKQKKQLAEYTLKNYASIKRREEAIKSLRKYMKRNKYMEYSVGGGSTNPKDTAGKIKHFIETYNLEDGDIWVMKSKYLPGFFQIGINWEKAPNKPLNEEEYKWPKLGGEK